MKFLTLFFLSLLFCTSSLFAQKQMGIAAMPVIRHSVVPHDIGSNLKSAVVGFRGEFIKSKLGLGRLGFSYWGIALSGFFPYKEDMVVYAVPTTGTGVTQHLMGKRIQSQWDGIVKFGFEVPQGWNDFLFFNIGLGCGISHATVKYKLPSYDSHNYYLNYDYAITRTDIEKGFGVLMDEFISVFYEFDKFYIFGQVEGVDNLNLYTSEGISVRFNAGIYYKITQTD